MAISFVAASAVVTGPTPTVAIPTGYTSNDLLIIITVGSTTAATPSGWTLLSAENLDQFFTIFYKVASASESSVALTNLGSNGKATMLCYRGASGAFETLPAYVKVTGTSLATPTLTTTSANDVVVSLYATGTGGGTLTPAAATVSRINSATNGSFKGLLIADETQANVGLSTARTATQSTSAGFASFAIGIKPGIATTPIAARLYQTGVYATSSIFDEVTQAGISITPAAIYAAQLDEITIANGSVAKRETKDGTIQISGTFDEVTGIS